MTDGETTPHAADLILQAGSITKRDTSIETVFDKAAQDLRIPLSSQAIYWRPRHMETSPLLGQIPFIFWLMESIRPTSVVQVGTADGVVYMSLCQAVERLNLHASCLGLETRDSQFHDRLRQQHDEQYTDFSILIRDGLDSCIHYVQDTIDLLVLHDVLDDADMDRLVDEWLPLLSERAVILICEPGRILLNERLRKALDQKPGQSVISGPVSLGGSRLDVILHGASQPERLQALASLRQGHPAYLAARMVFNRLGQGLEETQRARELVHQRDQALSSLQDRVRDDAVRQDEIASLKKGLQDSGARQAAARDECETLHKELDRHKHALSDKNHESENLHQEMRRLRMHLEKSETALNVALARIEALDSAPARWTATDGEKAAEQEPLPNGLQEQLALKDRELDAAKEQLQERINDIAAITEHFSRELDRTRQSSRLNLENEIALEVGKVVSAIFREENRTLWRKGITEKDHVNLLVRHNVVDPEWYRAQNRDVVDAGMDPALHYLLHGAAEGRPARKRK